MFRDVLRDLARRHQLPADEVRTWTDDIDGLLRCSTQDLQDCDMAFSLDLLDDAELIQRAGLDQYGDGFKFIGFHLVQLRYSRRSERHKDKHGHVRFTARPVLTCHLLVFSAHLTQFYASHRLGIDSITSPFEHTVVRHTKTRVVNLRNMQCAATHFQRDPAPILDAFAVLVRRNVLAGRTTVLISRKGLKSLCAEYLDQRLQGWGIAVSFVVDGYDQLPEQPDPGVIPILHYGIRGINDFEHYESAYCLNAYYIPGDALARRLREAEPDVFTIPFEIKSAPDRVRRVRFNKKAMRGALPLAQAYLQKLELDPVIQVAGRVRFQPQPREVVICQANDLGRDLGPVEEVRTLGQLPAAFDEPTAKQLDRQFQAVEIRRRLAKGEVAQEIADSLAISRSTLFRRLKEADEESVKTPIYRSSIYGRFDTPPAAGDSRGAAS